MELTETLMEHLETPVTVVLNRYLKSLIIENYIFYKNNEKVSKNKLKELLDNPYFGKELLNILEMNVYYAPNIIMEARINKEKGKFEINENIFEFKTEKKKGTLVDVAKVKATIKSI